MLKKTQQANLNLNAYIIELCVNTLLFLWFQILSQFIKEQSILEN